MGDRLYIVTFDTSDPLLSLASMKTMLDEDAVIKAWWNHIPGVFFLETNVSASDLAKRVKARMGSVRFVAVEVRPEEMNGLLPERSWDWLVKRSQAARQMQPATTAG